MKNPFVLIPALFWPEGPGTRDRALALLEKVGVAERADAYPGTLSSGEMKRVAIARALINNPSILIADEPTGDLDVDTESEIMGLFGQLNAEGITIVMVTHNPDLIPCATHIYAMNRGALVKNPDKFRVIAAPNMFGDIVTDLLAEVTGGLGLAPGGNINPKGISMFEPVHGSAPKYKGMNTINPIATILAAKLMLDNLGRRDLGDIIHKGVRAALDKGVYTKDLGGSATTSEMGDAVVAAIHHG